MIDLRTAAVAGVAVLLFAACGASPHLASYSDLGIDSPTGLQRGTLVEDHGCLLLDESPSHSRWLVLWPRSYKLDGPSILDGDGHVVSKVGDGVELGGGEYRDADMDFLKTRFRVDVSDSCRSPTYWLETTLTVTDPT
jgi:hypothetical protein